MSIDHVKEAMKETEYSDGVVVSDPEVDVAPEVLEETEEEKNSSEVETINTQMESLRESLFANEALQQMTRIQQNLITMRDNLKTASEAGVESMDGMAAAMLQNNIETELSRLNMPTRIFCPGLESMNEDGQDIAIAVEQLDFAIEKMGSGLISGTLKALRAMGDFFKRSSSAAKKIAKEADGLKKSIVKMEDPEEGAKVKVKAAHHLVWNEEVSGDGIAEGLEATKKVAQFVYGDYTTKVNEYWGRIDAELDRLANTTTIKKTYKKGAAKELNYEVYREFAAALKKHFGNMTTLQYIGDHKIFMSTEAWSKKGNRKVNYSDTIDVPSKAQLTAICDNIVAIAGLAAQGLDRAEAVTRTEIEAAESYEKQRQKHREEGDASEEGGSTLSKVGDLILKAGANYADVSLPDTTGEYLYYFFGFEERIGEFTNNVFSSVRAATDFVGKCVKA